MAAAETLNEGRFALLSFSDVIFLREVVTKAKRTVAI
jgi:hypothetical protein